MIKYLLTTMMLLIATPALALTASAPDPAGSCNFESFGSIAPASLCLGPQNGPIFADDLSGVLGFQSWVETLLVEEFDAETKEGSIFLEPAEGPTVLSVKAGRKAVAVALSEAMFVYKLSQAISHFRTFTPAAIPLPAPLLMLLSALALMAFWRGRTVR